jgi:hypothetical protein
MFNTTPVQGEAVPAWAFKVVLEPDTFASAFAKAATIQGREELDPDTHMTNAPKLDMFGMFVGVELMASVKETFSFALIAETRVSYKRVK